MNVDAAWLLRNGISQETLDRCLKEGSQRQPLPVFEWDVTFEPVVRRDVRTWIPITGWRPATLNEMARSVRAKINLKQRDRAIIAEAARLAHLPPAAGKRQLSLVVRVPKGQRRWDSDAFWKSTLDACVHARLLINDSPVWLQMGSCVYDPRRGRLCTTLVLEDLPGDGKT